MAQRVTVYVGRPDIPAGMTIGEYRRQRRCEQRSWWQRVLGLG